MTTVVIDATTRDKLRSAGGAVLLTDENGTLLGEFRPKSELDPSQYIGRWMTDAEAARYVAEELPAAKLIPAAEVEQRLKELRKCS